MSPKTPSPMIATPLILGGTVFGVLGALHAVYTLLDLHNPRDDLSLSILRLHTRWRILCSDYRVRADMWRAWVGFNFRNSLGVLMVAGLALWAGSRFNTLPVSIIMPALTLIGCAYEVLALLYWFRAPAIGVAVGTGCFAAAWVLSLR